MTMLCSIPTHSASAKMIAARPIPIAIEAMIVRRLFRKRFLQASLIKVSHISFGP
ncbi:MAG: hypothetical protein MJE68_14385 [Proteobacteria bacterium]|nr:hypothetical protein [Pseudomonadota bacterium]